MADGSDRQSERSKEREINRACLQTGLYIAQPRKAHQSKDICPQPKTVVGSILIDIMAITLLQLLKLQSNYAEILSQQE